jgi:hypothetical protein
VRLLAGRTPTFQAAFLSSASDSRQPGGRSWATRCMRLCRHSAIQQMRFSERGIARRPRGHRPLLAWAHLRGRHHSLSPSSPLVLLPRQARDVAATGTADGSPRLDLPAPPDRPATAWPGRPAADRPAGPEELPLGLPAHPRRAAGFWCSCLGHRDPLDVAASRARSGTATDYQVFRSEDGEVLVTPVRAPKANAFAGRWGP